MSREKRSFFSLGNLIKLLITSFFLFLVIRNVPWDDRIFLYKGDAVKIGKLLRSGSNDLYYVDSKTGEEKHRFLNQRFNISDQSLWSKLTGTLEEKFYVIEALPNKAVGDDVMARPLERLEGHLENNRMPDPQSKEFYFYSVENEKENKTLIQSFQVAGGIEVGIEPSVPNLLRDINLKYFALAFFMIVISQILPAFRWRLLMQSGGLKMPLWTSVKLVYMGYFLTQVVPSVGDVFRAVIVARENAVDRATAALSVFIDRLVGLFSVVIIGSAAVLLNFDNPHVAPYRNHMLIPMVILFAFSIVYFSRSLRRLSGFEWLLNHILGDRLRKIEEKIFAYRERKLALLKAFALTAIVQINFIVINFLLAKSLDLPEGHFWDFFLIIPIITVIVAIPMSMGGFGVREGLFMTLFLALGMNPSIGLTTSFLQWVIMMAWSLPGGLALLSLKKEYKSKPFS